MGCPQGVTTGSFMSNFNESAYPLEAEIAEKAWFFSVGPIPDLNVAKFNLGTRTSFRWGFAPGQRDTVHVAVAHRATEKIAPATPGWLGEFIPPLKVLLLACRQF